MLSLINFLIVFQLLTSVYAHPNVPVGHLEPLGSHAQPLDVEHRYRLPSPQEFYNNYVKPGVPVVLKQAAKRFPCYQRWTDQYLRKFGNWKVLIEEGKKEDRQRPSYFMSLNEFLDGYKTNDTYLVHDLVPPNPMTDEVPVPQSIQCGGLQNNIQSVVMWFSSGGTKSTLHAEGVDSFECILDGWKEYLLLNKKDGESTWSTKAEEYQALDVDRVDLIKFPVIAQVPWHKLHAEPGDCYFIPYGWYHFVNSSNTRNLALSFWMTHIYRFDEKDCQKKESHKTVLSQVKMSDPRESARVAFLDLFLGGQNMSRDIFRKFFAMDSAAPDQEAPVAEAQQKSRDAAVKKWMDSHKTKHSEKIFQFIDKNTNGILDIDEVYAAPLALFEKLIGALGEEYMGYETMGEDGRSGADVLKERKRLFLRNEL